MKLIRLFLNLNWIIHPGIVWFGWKDSANMSDVGVTWEHDWRKNEAYDIGRTLRRRDWNEV